VFSSQHDARFRYQNSTHTIISFLDNASDLKLKTSDHSTALLVSLSTATNPMTATAIKKWERPDHGLTNLRGNVQFLPNSNVFVGWSSNGYTSEFTADGKLLQEVRYPSDRFGDYRAYKFNFTGFPSEPISLVSQAYGTTAETITTVFHVSWNGATEVSAWNFYSSTEKGEKHGISLLAHTPKSGFETMAMSLGYHKYVFAEAVAANGTSLGNSSIETTIVPPTSFNDQESIFEEAEAEASNGTFDMEEKDPHSGVLDQIGDHLQTSLLIALVLLIMAPLVACIVYRERRRRGRWEKVGNGDSDGDGDALRSAEDAAYSPLLSEPDSVPEEVDIGAGSETEREKKSTSSGGV
jgi:hypothetical protein